MKSKFALLILMSLTRFKTVIKEKSNKEDKKVVNEWNIMRFTK